MGKHGRYTIVRKVADGGMAEIFLATQLGREGFQKPVILKRIHTTIYADPQFRNMFLDEAHISMTLSHSNIVQVLDLGSGGGRYFLVMELVDGWDLGRIIHRAAAAKLPLLPELGLHITAEVCRALAYAHSRVHGGNALGIVHRDVSPHNVLVSDQGEVKLTDFGIAKAMNKREQTGTGVVKGKVSFMSPEQALGKSIDARSDLFSLGTVLYQLMTGVRPFEAATDLEILLRVQHAQFRPPEETQPDMEPELAQIMMRAMKLDPAERYQSADEMLIDIERVLRTVFRPVGQTELKRWLGDLQREDGVPSIGKAPAVVAGPRTGTGELEGKDVELSDSDADVGEENTSLAVLGPPEADGRPRLNRHRVTELPLPVPDDGEADLSGRHSQSELALPMPEVEDGPPGRRRGGHGGRWLGLLLVGGVLLIVGAALAGSYLGSRTGDDSGGPERAAPGAAVLAPPPARETTSPARAPAPAAPPVAPAPAPQPTRAAETPGAREAKGSPPATAASPIGAPAPAREGAPRRERAEREPRRAIIELKNMMQPDPSQLPPLPAPAPTPTPTPAPPPRAAEKPPEGEPAPPPTAPAPAPPTAPPAPPAAP
ncbi:MAG TPA: serine/threonine-protein kinase [Polyangia bacterium]|nr:serine/threonine-protein kinase [Polyangia bacterium]